MDHDSAVRFAAILACIHLLFIAVLPVGITVYYDVMLATTLFVISRLRAMAVCFAVYGLSLVILAPAGLPGVVILPSQLSSVERQAADSAFAIARIESLCYAFRGSYLPLGSLLLSFTAPQIHAENTRYSTDVKRLRQVKDGSADAYVFTVVSEHGLTYVQATPRVYSGESRYSFLVLCKDDPDGFFFARGGDRRGGKATITDRILLPPQILRY